jgi:hypothetical protein
MAKEQVKIPTQSFIPVDVIKEGIMIMKNKSLRGVILASSLNFALKAEDEQEAIIYQFQDFLNSLDFQTQILVQSRRINMTGYIEKIKGFEKNQKNELLKLQTTEYRKFIEEIIGEGSIMTKQFYLVIPYFPLTELVNFAADTEGSKEKLTEQKFQAAKYQLWQRMEFVAMGLKRCGIRSAPLKTAEIVELLWASYHLNEAEFGYYPEFPPELIQ